MLVLTRKVNEVILVNDNIEIKLVSVDGSSVRIGINAPKDVSIHRKEVYEKIKDENKKAIDAKTVDLSSAVLKLRNSISKKDEE